MRLFLARHGQTQLNVERKFYGSNDCVLNSTGEKQAKELAAAFAGHHLKFDAVYCSGLYRTYQTAFACVKDTLTIKKMPGLDEKGFGKWEALDADEIQAQYPVEWQKWLDQPFDYVPPEAEGYYPFAQRVQTAIDKIIQTGEFKHQENILVVAHLGTLRVVDQYLLHDSQTFWDIHFDAGTYTEFISDDQDDFHLEKRNVR
ncbi:histidine phosphatase family protein [Companilactobacillus versmoldensis]|uniref:phosphoglycerate mutase (2,3-diphosphoglycerate-dependent) n=1 Tax=Companilactobacillus versmoldensis DSM 14857 = KCTC 3814 TaxID=1423815 RepID=A0A0R1SKP1_9LACO|nr:histidine phosphatase family protein [Companilactobacillus versmoldensis]KRL68212.1 alpha-ribazole-5-phosphate phosphatase [Companilactobacillus versmoldensis DSM 14857 = KCTC 3814]